MPEIGKRIRSRREQLGMTQEELASRLGYKSKTTIAKIENGTNDIVQSKVTEFAKVLDTTPAYLMGWTQLDGNVVNEKEPELTARDEKDIAKILEQTKEQLLSQEGLMFDGDPASPEAINSILDAMQIGMEMAKKKNKEKYTPKKYKKD
ncbi:helix-turn-helix domain-containing protein [Clostridium sp. AF20-17LB]|jgi:transcriptional regulator with XRE-family HTH domain|nr:MULTISPECIES: helix-turn-helix domain-containing protein [unclassified Clostridium]MBT9789359.1 helix-turn-helix domain-containing protein [Clostridium sp. MCC344]RHR09399.1 helix-turn-helix domain-containing protein [Clostridium sp. AF20-17LB]DAM41922.1 MAG TPA: helix-turn-helix domain protein [Bacteriophage sp.]